ncbi:unnamed protein product [Rhodiola kirilowii]
MSIISWNCRGVGGPRAVRSIFDVVKTHRPSILGLIETKKSDADWNFLRCKLGFSGCLPVASQGRSGGLVLMWTEDVEVDLNNLSSYHIDVEVRGLADYEFQLTLLYGRPRADDRMESWNLLRRLRIGLGWFLEILMKLCLVGK